MPTVLDVMIVDNTTRSTPQKQLWLNRNTIFQQVAPPPPAVVYFFFYCNSGEVRLEGAFDG